MSGTAVSRRAYVSVWTTPKCLRCGRKIEPGETATVTRGGFAWLHRVCATLRNRP